MYFFVAKFSHCSVIKWGGGILGGILRDFEGNVGLTEYFITKVQWYTTLPLFHPEAAVLCIS